VKLLCYGTLAGGFFSERWLDRPEPTDDEIGDNWSRMKYLRFIRTAGGWDLFQNLLRAVSTVARRHAVSASNVAVRWVLQQPAVASVLVGTRLGISDHTEDNARLFSFELDADDLAMIGDARSRLLPIPGDCGDEYRRPPFLTAAGDLSDHQTRGWRPPLCERRPGDETVRAVYATRTPWEGLAAYSRAVRRADRISVSGTTATYGDRLIGEGDSAAQAAFCLDRIEAAVEALGGRLDDIVRTRVYVPRVERDWEPVARAHGRRFASICPANTLVGAALVGKGYLVEMEADALIRGE
jgi:enamine deaminase RidA (YjgF/YER057c/UK114 family)